jgi:ParB-like chromosome segregation protein Spo0J
MSSAAAHRCVHRTINSGQPKEVVLCLEPSQRGENSGEAQIVALMKSIRRVWTVPILIDERQTILAGHLRVEVAKRLGMTEVPTIMIAGLSESEKRAVQWDIQTICGFE